MFKMILLKLLFEKSRGKKKNYKKTYFLEKTNTWNYQLAVFSVLDL